MAGRNALRDSGGAGGKYDVDGIRVHRSLADLCQLTILNLRLHCILKPKTAAGKTDLYQLLLRIRITDNKTRL